MHGDKVACCNFAGATARQDRHLRTEHGRSDRHALQGEGETEQESRLQPPRRLHLPHHPLPGLFTCDVTAARQSNCDTKAPPIL